MEFGNEKRPECNNLLAIYQLVSGKTQQVKILICLLFFGLVCRRRCFASLVNSA
jgi:hypothetical protein